MVSGRPVDAHMICKRCNKEIDLYVFADREKRLCPKCYIEDAPLQLSLLSLSCERKNSKQRELKRPKQEYKVKCEKCGNWLNPSSLPWFAARCQLCWPPEVAEEWYEKWQRYNNIRK